MTAILFAKDDATNGETPAPKRGRAANSRAVEAKLDRHHDESISAAGAAIKRAVHLSGFCWRKAVASAPRQGGPAGVWSTLARPSIGAAAKRGGTDAR
jgi:hypothetical protein